MSTSVCPLPALAARTSARQAAISTCFVEQDLGRGGRRRPASAPHGSRRLVRLEAPGREVTCAGRNRPREFLHQAGGADARWSDEHDDLACPAACFAQSAPRNRPTQPRARRASCGQQEPVREIALAEGKRRDTAFRTPGLSGRPQDRPRGRWQPGSDLRGPLTAASTQWRRGQPAGWGEARAGVAAVWPRAHTRLPAG